MGGIPAAELILLFFLVLAFLSWSHLALWILLCISHLYIAIIIIDSVNLIPIKST